MAKTTTAANGAIHLLATRQVLAATTGDLSDGGGLVLRVSAGGASWVLRYTGPSGKRREIGLGPAYRASLAQAGESLAAARHCATKTRESIRQGIDPLAAREAQRNAAVAAEQARKAATAREALTLARAARNYHERVIEPSRSSKHAAQWLASLENHVPASLWHSPVDSIEAPALLTALQAIKPHERARNLKGDKLPETVQRIRQRLDAVFEDAIFHRHCVSNPAAAIKRKMREAWGRRQRGQFRALNYREAPALLARLRAAEGASARCLELAVLTASRTSEVLLAEWAEFDQQAAIWTIPAARMKARESHVVHLSDRAMAVLASMAGRHSRWVFPSPVLEDRPMSNMSMLAVLGRLGVRDKTTVHGLARATFSTWANETGAARPDVIEACLAHQEVSRVRAAYNRAEFLEARKVLMNSWAEFLERAPAQVLSLTVRNKAA